MVTVEYGSEKYTFEGDAWAIADNESVHVTNAGALIASFLPGSWDRVWKTESKVAP